MIIEVEKQEKYMNKLVDQYSQVFDQMSVGYALADLVSDGDGHLADLQVLKANRSFEKFLPIQTTQIIGEHLSNVLPSLVAKIIQEHEGNEMKDEKPHIIHLGVIRNKYIQAQIFYTKDTQLTILLRDATLPLNYSDLMQEKDDRIRLLTDYAPFGIILTDAHGECTYANKRWTEIADVPLDKLLGKGWRDSIEAKDREIIIRGWFGANDAGRQIPLEFHINKSDSQVLWVEGNSVALRDETHTITGYLCTLIDITTRKKAEEERLILRTKLLDAQKMESIGTLAAGIAHDFNNILNIIMGYVSWLSLNEASREDREKYLQIILQATQRGADLVQQILTFARRKEVVFSSFKINPLIQELVRMLSETFPKMIKIKTQLAADIPAINGDASHLHQAILNICVNARDAMPMGGEISIHTEMIAGSSIRGKYPHALENQYIKISISDNGEGIDEHILQRIFEPFFTTKIQGKGTGLGLSVVYGVVDAHRGIIDVVSNRNSGSSFNLYLPVPVQTEKYAEVENELDGTLLGGSETILVIEDERDYLELLQSLIEDKGYTILTATNGRSGLDTFLNNREKIDLLLCDLDLPEIRGEDVLNRIWVKNPSMKAILMSGYINPQLRSQFSNDRTCCILEKPLKPHILFKTIRHLLDLPKK